MELHRLGWASALKRLFIRKYTLLFNVFLCFYLEKIIFVSKGLFVLIEQLEICASLPQFWSYVRYFKPKLTETWILLASYYI